MHPEIEKLIEMALADEQVTEKEREIILRKAEKLDLDLDEVEMYLEGKINENETISTTKKEISNLNYKSSINKEESQSRIYTLKKVNHLKPETLNKESDLKLIIDDINKNNSNLLDKLNNLFSKINEPHDFLLNQKTKVDNQIEIIKVEYNNLSKIHLDRFFNEINKQVSKNFGLTKLIINSPQEIIGLNSNEIIELIKHESKWDVSELNKRRKKYSNLFLFLSLGPIYFIYLNSFGSENPNTYLVILGILILFLMVGKSGNYLNAIEKNETNFTDKNLKPILIEIITKFENEFNELIILKTQLNELERLNNKLELISISECEIFLRQNN